MAHLVPGAKMALKARRAVAVPMEIRVPWGPPERRLVIADAQLPSQTRNRPLLRPWAPWLLVGLVLNVDPFSSFWP